MPIASLSQLEHYRLDSRVEDEPCYATFQSHHPSSGQKVLVTAFSARFAKTEGFKERFAECVARTQRASHENLAKCYGGGYDSAVDMPYIVLEVIEGRSLADMLAAGSPPSILDAAEAIGAAAEALKALRAQNVLHRDIRPASLRFSRDGALKLVNLGRAGLLPPNSFRAGVDAIVGDPLYMAPETAIGRPVDLRSDIYSLAATAYHVMAGRPPFQGEGLEQLSRQHASAQPDPLNDINANVPGQLWEIIRDCLSKDPAQRYSDYDTFLIDWKETIRASNLTRGGGAPGTAAAAMRGGGPPGVAPGTPPRTSSSMEMSSPSGGGKAMNNFDDLSSSRESIDLPPPDKVGGGGGGGGDFDDLSAIMPGKKPMDLFDGAESSVAHTTKSPVIDYEPEGSGFLGKLLWLIVLAALAAGAYAGYNKFVGGFKLGGGSDPDREALMRWTATNSRMSVLAGYVQTHKVREGVEPSSLDDLISAGQVTEDDLVDGYGNSISFDRYAKELISSGPDGEEGNGDDFRFSLSQDRMVKHPPKPEVAGGLTEEEQAYSTGLGKGGE